MTNNQAEKKQRFLALADEFRGVIAKVCSIYANAQMPFADLYQEVMINLWKGLDTFRGEAKPSTWIYRLALNTCISLHRKNHSYEFNIVPIAPDFDVPEVSDSHSEEVAFLYRLIARLDQIDKALVTLWLDEKSYDEISAIMGMSKTNVATRLARAKQKLSKMASQIE